MELDGYERPELRAHCERMGYPRAWRRLSELRLRRFARRRALEAVRCIQRWFRKVLNRRVHVTAIDLETLQPPESGFLVTLREGLRHRFVFRARQLLQLGFATGKFTNPFTGRELSDHELRRVCEVAQCEQNLDVYLGARCLEVNARNVVALRAAIAAEAQRARELEGCRQRLADAWRELFTSEAVDVTGDEPHAPLSRFCQELHLLFALDRDACVAQFTEMLREVPKYSEVAHVLLLSCLHDLHGLLVA